MVVITSFSQKLYDKYAHRLIETFDNWPEEARLVVYTEDMPTGKQGRIEYRRLDFADLRHFQMACEPSEDYRYDAARFANKVWAMIHGSLDETDLCFWLDADCVTHRRLSSDYLRKLIPSQYYMGSFERPNYTETGFWGVRASHLEHRNFMHALKDVYLSGQIFKLPQWHDCMALDYVRRKFERDGKIRAIDLTKTLNGRGSHVIATSELGRFIDHTKGQRKERGYSPENRWHKELHESGRSPVLGSRE